MSVVESSRSEFATLGTQGIRERLLNSMQAMYNSFTEAVDSVFSRMTGASVSNATRELAESLAERLATITDDITDDAVIRTRITEAIQAVAPAEVGNQQLITAIRNLLVVRSLPGANSALRTLGEQFANRAKSLLTGIETGLSYTEKANTTIAVSRIRVNNAWIEIVTVWGNTPETAVAKIRQAVEAQGGIFRRAPRGVHAESFLYSEFHLRDGFEAIGVSNYAGPCDTLCQPFFQRTNFFNVYWDSTYIP